tara:strand:+ start:1076 stop:1351 length:276 start_codon:yes stop_codon:yes gene_type:complete
MSITYALAEYTADDATVEATYTNADGHTHTRTLIIQKNEDGTINQDAWDAVLAGQLQNVINKSRVGVITFLDPNATPEGASAASEDAETAE